MFRAISNVVCILRSILPLQLHVLRCFTQRGRCNIKHSSPVCQDILLFRVHYRKGDIARAFAEHYGLSTCVRKEMKLSQSIEMRPTQYKSELPQKRFLLTPRKREIRSEQGRHPSTATETGKTVGPPRSNFCCPCKFGRQKLHNVPESFPSERKQRRTRLRVIRNQLRHPKRSSDGDVGRNEA